MNETHWKAFLRILAAVTAVGLWSMSVIFSVDGFNFQISGKSWMGIVLGLAVTSIELVWNREGGNHNLTIFITGLLAYIYGVMTNFLGIIGGQGATIETAAPFVLVFSGVLSFLLEVVPEPLILWAMVGVSSEDLLSRLFNAPKSVSQAQPGPSVMERHIGPAAAQPAFHPNNNKK